MSSVAYKQVIENINNLSSEERALVAHCLITSLETPANEDNVEQDWTLVAEKRYQELESGKVNGVSWDEIKKEIQK
ncbi:MAG: addiction module protein [Gammaproteobacteria bacterium]|nr:addiction module protein [Gammaproteobacteria bacterium]